MLSLLELETAGKTSSQVGVEQTLSLCWSLPTNLEVIRRPAGRVLLKCSAIPPWLQMTKGLPPTCSWYLTPPDESFVTVVMEGTGFWKEIRKSRQGRGEGDAYLSPKQYFFACFAVPLFFAIFLSLPVNALILSLKIGLEGLLFSEEKVS